MYKMSMSSVVVLVLVIVGFSYAEGNNDCDKLGILLYEDLGCKAMYELGQACPVEYVCDLAIRNYTCLFKGQEIPVGKDIPNDLTYGNCNVGCSCVSGLPSVDDFDKIIDGKPVTIPGQFQCAILDCPEWLGVPVDIGCHRTYDLNSCCSSDKLCPTPGTELHTCNVDGNSILEGLKFYPDNTCQKCICSKNFTGKLEEPHCMRVKCDVQIRNQREVQNFCAPLYSGSKDSVLCCPSDWICPSAKDTILPSTSKRNTNSDLTCLFGEQSFKLGEGLETKSKDLNNKEFPVRCECILPPFLTCRSSNDN